MNKWTTEFPTKPGNYWFYGYRYGKYDFNGEKRKLELMYCEVHKAANGFIYIANGQFVYKSEVEEPHFQEVILPELPTMNGE